MRVLLIDDHAPVRKNLRELIEISGEFQVVGEGSNGVEAIDLAATLDPELVLMDINMPELDGIEATRVIRELHPEVKVLALTALGDMSNVSAMVKAGASGYLLKGGAADELLESLHAVAKGQGALGKDMTIDVMQNMADLESQLRQAQKMEAIGRLAGGVAHDFNNLLSIIQNYARFIAEDLEENDPKRYDVTEIMNATERAGRLVRQLLTFSRKDVTRPENVDMNELVSSLDHLLQRTLGEDIHLETTLAEGLSPIRIDPTQMDQVLMNLVVNARDAMPRGGGIQISTHNVVVDDTMAAASPGLVPGDYVCMSVRDEGEGMTPEVAEQIFEPFFTTKPRDSGTGLGLSTVYGIVKQAGGYIYVDTAPDAGTTFRVYLPVIGAELPADETPAPETEVHAREKVESATVLVVEDETAVRRLVERILWGNGYTILSASSGQEALEFVTKYGFDIDLLITDVVMPGLSGRELAARLSVLRPDVGVLYMSGYSDDVVGRHGLEAGEPFLQKPFTAEELKDAVRKMLITDRAHF
ncbi:MAG: response regulator [Actinomycetota bacterium]